MAGRVIEMDCGDDQVGYGDEVGGFGEERQERDEIVSVVVGLVVEDYAGLVGRWVCWRHIGDYFKVDDGIEALVILNQ